MTGTDEALPEALEDRLYAIHFDHGTDDREGLLQSLYREHPEHADTLQRRARALARSDRLLGQVREGFHDAVDHERVGPFEIERVLGEGGFGTVYLAMQHEPVRRQVALKVLQSGRGDTRARQRFEDERHLLARLQHACIAQVYDAGITDERVHYFAMEYVDGAPITAWCERHQVDVDARLRLFLRVCAAIHHAHQREIVHRDIKPSNVLVRDEDGQPLPKVIDFGIAKLLAGNDDASRDLTMQGGQIGTPGYMSPEQAAGDAVDTRTDVYSLGVLLCELLTGDTPVSRERLRRGSFVAMARVLADEPPSRPSRLLAKSSRADDQHLRNRLQEDLDWIVLKAVTVDREQRYSSVAELKDDVERHLRGEPVHARQRATAYLLRKFVRRHRLAVAVAGLLLTSLVAVIASLSWGLDVADEARGQAESERDVARARERAARMAVAQLALDSGDVQTARTNLSGVAVEQRGWAWRHLAAHSNQAERVIPIGIGCLEVQWLDDERVATFPMYEPPTVWNTITGDSSQTSVWEGSFRRVALDRDRHLAVVVGDDGIGVWDVDGGLRLRSLGRAPGEVFAIAWSPDRQQVAISGRGRWLDVIDVETGALRRRLRLRHNATGLTFCRDTALAVAFEDGPIQLVDYTDGVVHRSWLGHADSVDHLLVDADRDRLYSASIDGTVRGWRLSDGEPLATLPCNVRMRRLQLSKDGGTLYACGGWTECRFRAWETDTFGLVGHYHGHLRGVGSIDLSPDGSRLASVSRDATLRIWSSRPPTRAVRLDAGRDMRVLSASRDGTRFGAASYDGRITVWNAHTLTPELQLETKTNWTGSAIGDDVLYVAGPRLRAYELPSGQVVAEGSNGGRRVEQMLLTPDGHWLAGGHLDHLLLWRLPELELRHDLELPVGAARMVWDPHTECIVVGGSHATLRWIEPATGEVHRELVVQDTAAHTGALAQFGDVLVTGANSELLVYRDGAVRHRMTTRHTCAAIWPDGRRLVTGGHDQRVRVWDLTTGDQLLVFGEPEYVVEGVHVVDGGSRIVALSHRWDAPSYIYVWSAPEQVELGR